MEDSSISVVVVVDAEAAAAADYSVVHYRRWTLVRIHVVHVGEGHVDAARLDVEACMPLSLSLSLSLFV